MVRRREEKLRRGEITIDDLTIKNAIPFLKLLYDKGIKLWLTSGTDTADVKHEAALLGHDYLFEGRIYGGTGNINAEAKKMVLDSILDSIGNEEASSIITFGDGPVEIRETHKRGGITAGVASNEAAIGRTALRDFLSYADSVSDIDGGVCFSVGSAVMSPMIFEKSLSMAQNVEIRNGKHIGGHLIVVVDLAENEWDWNKQGFPLRTLQHTVRHRFRLSNYL
ncbi:MAG: HAD family hydrolase [Bacteroidales bacterium]